MKNRRTGILIIAALGAATVAHASSARVWVVQGGEQFMAATLDGVSVRANGELELAPRVDVRFQGGNPRIWAAAAGPDDTVYLATGEEGAVLRIDASDTVSEYFEVDDGVVQALAMGPDGALYVGVSQPARIYRIVPGAPTPDQPWTELDASYVWDMALDSDGFLWVGTGEQGALWRIDEAGRPAVVYAGADAHVRSVTLAPGGGVFAGTSGQGLVLRVDPGGSAFVLLDSDFEEITGLGVRDDELWIAANAGATPPANGNGNGNGAAANGTAGPRGGVYRVDGAGVPELMWRSATFGLHSLAIVDGDVLVGTGTEGKVLRVTPHRAAGLLVDLESEQIVTIVALAEGAMVVGSNGAAVYRLWSEARESGSVLTAVRDAGAAATWGELRYEAPRGSPGSVQLYVRTGNTGTPDGTWSTWAGPYTQSGVAVEVPAARFAQIRIDLSEPDSQPRLRRLELVYVPRNSRPQIHALRAHPAGVVYRQNATFEDGLPFAQVPPMVAAQLREQEQGQGSGGATLGTSSAFRGRPLFIPGRRTFTWEASDPDGDSLDHRLDFRSEGVQRWNPLAIEIEGNSYVFDTTRVPDGRYEVRLTVSDAADNAATAVLEATATSAAFVVDNTPPTVAGLSAALEQDTVVRVTGRAIDVTSIVLRIRYSVNGGEWHTVLPADGAADSAEEPFEFDVSIVGDGEHTIVVQVADSALNRGAEQVTVRR